MMWIMKLFLLTPTLLSGDIAVDAWDQGNFELVRSGKWDGGMTLQGERNT